MECREIIISEGQHLQDVLPKIETNTILDKTICGCGATTLELNTPRHSIIIEPNLPVILGKKIKYSSILAVHEGVTHKHIEKYLCDNEEDGFYKIMTTPESFGKVRKAIRNARKKKNMYKDFFLLFDECEKTTQDIDYRKSITLPINDFFRSENKAMVSATPIMVKDPRFGEQKFRKIKIVPDYDYKHNLTLVPTNNVYTALKKYLNEELPKDEMICFFHNSTRGIAQIIEHLDIKQHSDIYCSTESRNSLIDKGYTNVFDNLNKVGDWVKLNKYNFFTSRFYSAVDIELPVKPIVVLITELFSAPYSVIDPQTEAVQIAGRFRNGISRLIHITNYNKKVRIWKQEDKELFLNDQHETYALFFTQWLNSKKRGERHILEQAMDRVDYSEFVLSNGDPNMFMYNNAIREEQIKSAYKNIRNIKAEYEISNAFHIDLRPCFFATTDRDRKIINPPKSKSRVELNKSALFQISSLIYSKCRYDIAYLNQIKQQYPIIYDGFTELGLKGVMATRYKDRDIQKAIDRSKLDKQLVSTKVRREVYKVFRPNTRYTRSHITQELSRIYDQFGIPHKKSGCSEKIKFYFEAKQDNQHDNRGRK